MKSNQLLVAACLAGALAIVTAVAWSRPSSSGTGDAAPRPGAAATTARSIPVDPLTLLHAQRFHTDQPFAHMWRADRQMYDTGWVLVLAGDPALLRPRQVAEQVLYVGAQTAERVNTGAESGKVVVLVPGDVDLRDAPIFLGPAALPEELWQEQIDEVLAAAKNGGAAPPTADQLNATVVEGTLEFADAYWLHRHAIDLVEQHSPQERDLISGWRAPLVR